LVIEGVTDDNQLLTISSVSRAGELGWAFELPSRWAGDIDIDAATGRTFAATNVGLAVIDADGQSCRQLSLPQGDGVTIVSLSSPRARGNYVYAIDGSGVSRYSLPADE
jgi:hypothetical protein